MYKQEKEDMVGSNLRFIMDSFRKLPYPVEHYNCFRRVCDIHRSAFPELVEKYEAEWGEQIRKHVSDQNLKMYRRRADEFK